MKSYKYKSLLILVISLLAFLLFNSTSIASTASEKKDKVMYNKIKSEASRRTHYRQQGSKKTLKSNNNHQKNIDSDAEAILPPPEEVIYYWPLDDD